MTEDQNIEQSPGDGKSESPEVNLSENISVPEAIAPPETEISKSEIREMEVHHHSKVERAFKRIFF